MSLKDNTKELIRKSSLESLRAIIRDAFLEGRDDEATRILQSDDYRLLKNGEFSRKRILGVNSSGPIGARTVTSIVVRPQLPFRANKFMVDYVVAPNFLIYDFRIGNESIFVQAGELSANLFSSPSFKDIIPLLEIDENGMANVSISDLASKYTFGIDIDFPLCHVSQDMHIIVENISPIPSTFRGAYLGNIE